MNRKFELHVISQIYDFLVEREGFTSLNLDRKVTEFFREVHVGQEEDFTILVSNKISGNFGEVSVVFKKLCHFLKLLKTGMMHYGNYI